MLPLELKGKRERSQKIRRRDAIGADEYAGRHAAVGSQIAPHVRERIAERRPGDPLPAFARRTGRRVRPQQPFGRQRVLDCSSVDQFAHRRGQQLKLVGRGDGLAVQHLIVHAGRLRIGQPLGQSQQLGFGQALVADPIGIHGRQLAGGDKPDPQRPDVVDVLGKPRKSLLRLFGRALRRDLPLLARRIGSTVEIHPVPELLMDELARMIADADQTSAFGGKALANCRHLGIGLLQPVGVVQIHAREVGAHVVDVQRPRIPERLALQAHVRALINVHGVHADVRERRDGLTSPGRSGLTVAGEAFSAKDPPHVRRALPFATHKLAHAVQQSAVGQVFGRRGVDRMEVAVVADIVLAQRGNHIGSSTPLQYASLFAHDLERGANLPLREQFRQPLGGVIGGRQEVVLGVKPEDNVDPRSLGRIHLRCGGNDRHRYQQPQRERIDSLHDLPQGMKVGQAFQPDLSFLSGWKA